MSSWINYHLKYLKSWRSAVEKVRKAVEDLGLNAEVYVIGGVAENRVTILSDIDVLVCLDRENLGRKEVSEIRRKILFTAIDKYGLPWDYPVEIHVITKNQCKEFLNNRKTLKIL